MTVHRSSIWLLGIYLHSNFMLHFFLMTISEIIKHKFSTNYMFITPNCEMKNTAIAILHYMGSLILVSNWINLKDPIARTILNSRCYLGILWAQFAAWPPFKSLLNCHNLSSNYESYNLYLTMSTVICTHWEFRHVLYKYFWRFRTDVGPS